MARAAASPGGAVSAKSSGRIPTTTGRPGRWPLSLARSRSSSGISVSGSLSAPPSIEAGRKFIAGAPMKPATKRLTGRS
jgi:hypothetical protein